LFFLFRKSILLRHRAGKHKKIGCHTKLLIIKTQNKSLAPLKMAPKILQNRGAGIFWVFKEEKNYSDNKNVVNA
jgi:hypothetical protein